MRIDRHAIMCIYLILEFFYYFAVIEKSCSLIITIFINNKYIYGKFHFFLEEKCDKYFNLL